MRSQSRDGLACGLVKTSIVVAVAQRPMQRGDPPVHPRAVAVLPDLGVHMNAKSIGVAPFGSRLLRRRAA